MTLRHFLPCLFFCLVLCLQGEDPLRIALYPYVPDLAHFEATLRQAWKAQGETREIEVVPYDYYVDPFPENLDILPTDPLYLDSYLKDGKLLPLPPEMLTDTDFFPFARAAGLREGKLYGIPAMTCASFLFYRPGDLAAQEASTMEELLQKTGAPSGEGELLPPGEGLYVSLESVATISIFAAKLQQALGSREAAWKELRAMVTMGRPAQVQVWKEEDVAFREKSFAQGGGRFLYGYPEAAAHLDAQAREALQLKRMPQADHRYYVNLYSLTANCPQEKREEALRLLVLMTSPKVMEESIAPEGKPMQYLLPARPSILNHLAERDSFYGKLSRELQNPLCQFFGLDQNATQTLQELGKECTKELNLEF
ncbi:MAG: extracellular solute-binding protein [Oligosphaeraceae bacterium]